MMNVLLFLVLALTISKGTSIVLNTRKAHNCQWTHAASKTVFDLSELAKTSTQGSDAGGRDYVYHFRPCMDSTDGPCGYLGSTLTQSSGDHCVSSIAFWRNPAWSLIEENSPQKGVRLFFKGGGKCSIGKREATVDFLCDTNAGPSDFTVKETSTCKYHATWRTKHVCTASSNGGVVGGFSAFMILIVFSFMMYLGIGYFYNMKYRDLKGVEAIPNLAFWKNTGEKMQQKLNDAFLRIKEYLSSKKNGDDYPGL